MGCCFSDKIEKHECCPCCECFEKILESAVCKNRCCKKFFPEWQVTSSWWIFALRTLILFLFSLAGVIFSTLWSERIFDTSRITWGSGLILALFMTQTTFLILVYGPYLIKVYPWWVTAAIFVIYIGFSLYLFIEQLVRGNLKQFKTDSVLFDIWTIVHFLAGPFFALCLPFIWMFIIVTAWEIMEYYTFGFGEFETLENRIVDILVAVVGWWVIIIIFKKTRKDIPWISSMNAAGNGGVEINWRWVFYKISCGRCFKDAADGNSDEKDVAQQMEYNDSQKQTQQTEVEL